MHENGASDAPNSHWLLGQARHTQIAMRVAFFAFFAVLFAWSRFLFGLPEGSAIDADFALLISGLAVALSILIGASLAVYQALLLKQYKAALISLLSGCLPLLELFLILQYLTIIRAVVLS